MSRAFTKDEAPEAPLVVPPRAPLPEGVPNYVTPAGLAALHAERAALDAERSRLDALRSDEDTVQRERRLVAGRLALLVARMALSRVVDPMKQTPGVVRFGATVTVAGDGGAQTVRIVGVDEAAASPPDAAPMLVAFTSPIARALTGKREGDAATLVTPLGDEALTVESIRYDG
jgi:transcription elongation factor GreB